MTGIQWHLLAGWGGVKASNPSIGGEWVVILLAALCYKIGDKSREL